MSKLKIDIVINRVIIPYSTFNLTSLQHNNETLERVSELVITTTVIISHVAENTSSKYRNDANQDPIQIHYTRNAINII